jgi:hypothetical protein
MVADLPLAVLKAAKKWDSHIPFTFLTDKFVNSPTAKLTSYAHSILFHPSIDSVTQENHLDIKNWECCSCRFLSLLQKFHPILAKEWEQYYNDFYFGGKFSNACWQSCLEYNILHRCHTLPAEHQEN